MKFMHRQRRRKEHAALLREALGQDALPSFPTHITAALQKLRDPRVPLGTAADELRADPLLATLEKASQIWWENRRAKVLTPDRIADWTVDLPAAEAA